MINVLLFHSTCVHGVCVCMYMFGWRAFCSPHACLHEIRTWNVKFIVHTHFYTLHVCLMFIVYDEATQRFLGVHLISSFYSFIHSFCSLALSLSPSLSILFSFVFPGAFFRSKWNVSKNKSIRQFVCAAFLRALHFFLSLSRAFDSIAYTIRTSHTHFFGLLVSPRYALLACYKSEHGVVNKLWKYHPSLYLPKIFTFHYPSE